MNIDEGIAGPAARVAKRRVRDEHETRSLTVEVTLIRAIGPEPWPLHVLEGKMLGVDAPAGRIVLGDIDVPDAVLSWATEHNLPYVHNVWVIEDMRGKGVAEILFNAYRDFVNPYVVAVGPFSPAGYRIAQRYADQVAKDPPKRWKRKARRDHRNDAYRDLDACRFCQSDQVELVDEDGPVCSTCLDDL